ncbi:MAG: tol-pal system-associated acyl-CoA thioesterase [Xanthomonadaceae bacterium]|jgi:acyl-CoA thioester hydrolase|nr:tol-pal system-associated acyl-CoA thioesterase [Xanthomonadaceae bacterium]
MFSFPLRIYWEDTDAGGVVYHARYLGFLERARSEWMRMLGYDQNELSSEHGLVFAVTSMQLDFRSPARLDDALQVTVALTQCGRASLVFTQTIRRGDELLVTARVKVAALGSSDFRPRALGKMFYEKFKVLESPESEFLRNTG